jgi:uncharacterized protein YukE
MDILDATQAGQVAAMLDTARQLQARASHIHDLIEQARRELAQAQYEGPAADQDRAHLQEIAGAAHGLGNALEELSASVLRAAANLQSSGLP